MESAQFKKAIESVSDQLIAYHDNLEKRRVKSDVQPGYLKKLLPEHPPEEGEDWGCIQNDIEAKIMPGMTHWNSPNFMAYFPAPTSYPSMLGELYSSALAVSAFNWDCAPAVTELEIVVMDWLVKMFSLPSCFLSTTRGGGVMQGSTSEAVLSLMVAARERYLAQNTGRLSGNAKEEARAQRRLRMVALASDAAHSCTEKAAMVLGIRYRSVPVRIEDGFSMTGAALAAVLQQCYEEGLEPFYLTATLGTTATCAVDRFDEVAHVLKDGQIWVHVDAAYAGAALVCEEYQQLTRCLGEFDSFSMSMSKWLLTNIDAVCCFIKDRRHLVDALSITPAYLRNDASDSGEVVDFRHWGVPLSRRFRSLKVWFVIRTYGVRYFKSYIRNHIRLGEVFASLIASRPDLFKLTTQPAYALTVITIVPRIPSVLRKLLAVKAMEATLSRASKDRGLQESDGDTEKHGADFGTGHRDLDGVTAANGEPMINGNGLSNGELTTNGANGASSANEHCAANGLPSSKDLRNLTNGQPSTNGQPYTNGLTNGIAEPMLNGKALTDEYGPNDAAETQRVWFANDVAKLKKPHTVGDPKSNGVHIDGNARSNGVAKDISSGHGTIGGVSRCIRFREAEDSMDGWLREYANMVTEEVYNLINERGEIMLTSSVVGGLFVIRINGANPKTEEKHIRKAFEILVSTAEEVLGLRSSAGLGFDLV